MGLLARFLKSGLYLKASLSIIMIISGDNAVKSYLTGHTLALEYASRATNVEELKYAYFVEGCADHFSHGFI